VPTTTSTNSMPLGPFWRGISPDSIFCGARAGRGLTEGRAEGRAGAVGGRRQQEGGGWPGASCGRALWRPGATPGRAARGAPWRCPAPSRPPRRAGLPVTLAVSSSMREEEIGPAGASGFGSAAVAARGWLQSAGRAGRSRRGEHRNPYRRRPRDVSAPNRADDARPRPRRAGRWAMTRGPAVCREGPLTSRGPRRRRKRRQRRGRRACWGRRCRPRRGEPRRGQRGTAERG